MKEKRGRGQSLAAGRGGMCIMQLQWSRVLSDRTVLQDGRGGEGKKLNRTGKGIVGG